jgi:teichuronic acid biosynthesis glycosyltransferase TuaC
VDLIHFRGARNPANYVKAWREVRRRLGAGGYSLVHAQWGQSGVTALPKQVPLVITFRGNDLEGIVGPDGRYTNVGRVQTLVAQFAARQADARIVVSDSLGRRLGGLPYEVIPSGLDLEVFHPHSRQGARQRLGLSPTHRYVLFAASPTNPRKRHCLAKSAVDRLPKTHQAELLVSEGVRHSDIPLYMSAADALILTSMHEGSPNVVKEALACDLPVVSVDTGDVRERIQPVEGCVLCEEETSEALAAGLMRVFDRDARVRGREAVADLDETLLTRRVISIYQAALARRGIRGHFQSNPIDVGS